MPAPHISATWLASVDRALRDAALDGEFRFSYLASALSQIGFIKCRYFELSSCSISNRSYFVARGASSDIDVAAIRDVILPADEVNNFAHSTSLQIRSTYGSSEELPRDLIEFHRKIGASGLPTVFVPIPAGKELVGKLCACWDGRHDDLNPEDISAIELLSRQVGRYRKLSQDVKVKKIEQKILNISFDHNDDGYLAAHRAFLNVLSSECPALISATFEHNWANNSLTKIVEIVHSAFDDKWFDEMYYRGEHITGFALSKDDAIAVSDLSSIDDPSYPMAEEGSLNRHAKLLNRPLSVAFARFESGHRDYVVRLSCQRSQLSSHFSNQDVMTLARICRRFGWHSNEYATKKNLWLIDALFRKSISDFSDYQSVVSEFEKIYSRVFNAPFVLAAVTTNSDEISHLHCSDEARTKRAANIAVSKLREFDEQKLQRDGVCIVSRAIFNRFFLCELIPDTEGTHVFIVRLSDADLKGMIYVPIRSRSSEHDIFQNLKQKTKTTLQIIGAIIASAISASSKHITTENAKRLIGQIGHEVESPINDLASAATHALFRLEDEIRRLDFPADRKMGLLREVSGALAKIDEKTAEISILMDIAVDMAQETENKLEVTFRTVNLFELMREAAQTVKLEIGRYHSDGTKINFAFDKEAELITSVVADRSLLSRIFLNMFRNAAKYSYSPGRGRIIDVLVQGRRRAKLIEIDIINWGVPVRTHDFERIFGAFQRGSVKDTLRARRGMGLGLYIARRFAKAHDGNVKCVSSEPTLDDPLRRLAEGYTTKFVVEISSTLAPTVTQRTFK